ncbi:MAG: hypothetical protein Aurels2KO_56560 [Aureliella sp.]
MTEGSLNGASLAGQSFSLTSTIVDTTDQNTSSTSGAWALRDATLSFGDGRSFVFDEDQLGFSIFLGQSNGETAFTASFLLDELNANGYFDLFGAFDSSVNGSSPPFDSLDPNVLSAFEFNDFEAAFSLGTGSSNVFEVSNLAGNTLRFDTLALPASLSAVPEPGSLLCLSFFGGFGAFLRRSRKLH